MRTHTIRVVALASAVLSAGSVFAADGADVNAELQALKTRIAELERKENSNWLTEERKSEIKTLVGEVIADARKRGELGSGDVQAGYKDGFFIQTADQNFKLLVGGFIQVRYEFAQHNAYNGRTLPSRTITTGVTTTPDDPINSNGFDIRRARISFAGNVWSKDVTFKLEGDFYGGTGGGFTVTDAFIGYRFNDTFKVKGGSFKVPFAKAELTPDTVGTLQERAEELAPFDPVRSIGFSLYGDIIKDKLAYDVMINDGGKTNTLRQDDTVGLTPNLDNRMGYYGRVQWAGNGVLKDFVDESDWRKNKDSFDWMVGAAAGYESQNATNNATPSPQTSTSIPGLSGNDGGGFVGNYNLNGDVYRATVDWSAKYRGWSFLAAAYFQQVNANPGNTSSSSTSVSTGPTGYGDAKSSFFQHAYYGQVGYFLIPEKFELVGRAGALLTEGAPNIGEFYTLGANYYIYGNNLKLQSDVTYSPEAAYTDAAASLLQNTHELIFRVQLQVKF